MSITASQIKHYMDAVWDNAPKIANAFICRYMEDEISEKANLAKLYYNEYIASYLQDQFMQGNDLELATENFIEEHTKNISINEELLSLLKENKIKSIDDKADLSAIRVTYRHIKWDLIKDFEEIIKEFSIKM